MQPYPPRTSMLATEQKKHANPLMALVDAAASILDAQERASDSSVESETTHRPQTPPVTKSQSILTKSPTSSISIDKFMEACYGETRATFVDQLMAVLDDDSHSDILTWMPDGSSFTIVDPKRFTRELMPQAFNIRNMSSFVRKLTRWGFSRKHDGQSLNSDIFKHPEFKRGKRENCRLMSSGVKPATSQFSHPLASTVGKEKLRAAGLVPSICQTKSTSKQQVPATTIAMKPTSSTAATRAEAPQFQFQARNSNVIISSFDYRRPMDKHHFGVPYQYHPVPFHPVPHQPPMQHANLWTRAPPSSMGLAALPY